eukprot:Nitzschia sp. Nitz4//scaffold81_size91200//17451//18003//NITZ4_004977-RA/size91200-snap-gene-0.18-mRNA-1//1//CDS//3329558683//5333//frame0
MSHHSVADGATDGRRGEGHRPSSHPPQTGRISICTAGTRRLKRNPLATNGDRASLTFPMKEGDSSSTPLME